MAILEVNKMKKSFGGMPVLRDVSFTLEQGQVLGLTKVQIFFRVVLLQVIKRIIPSMGNEIITLVKDTALARVIAVYEVTWAGESFIKKGLIWPLFYTGVFYLLFSGLLTVFFGWLEKKLNYFRG